MAVKVGEMELHGKQVKRLLDARVSSTWLWGQRAPGKGRIGKGKSFVFSADHAKISILGIIYYELRGSDNPSEREFPAVL